MTSRDSIIKINQSNCFFAGLIISNYWTGSSLYSKEETFTLAVPNERLTEPRTLFALFTVILMWLLHERSLVIVTPRSLKLPTSFRGSLKE